MKSLAHLMAGLAAASCFPTAVAAAADGNPLCFLLGGISALLPDMIDLKLLRCFYRHKAEVIPDPLDPDPQMIADAFSGAIETAAETHKPFRLRLHAIRLAANRWQRYRLHLDPANRQVTVTIAGITDAGGRLLHDAAASRSATASFSPPLRLDYTAATDITGSEGLHFEMTADAGGTVTPAFIPWFRQCSHSIIFGILLAAAAAGAWGLTAGIITGTGYATHLILDQAGYMGCNLLWPFFRHRSPGLQLRMSSGPLSRLAAIWLPVLLIWINISASTHPGGSNATRALRLMLLAGVLPITILAPLSRRIPRFAFAPYAPSAPAFTPPRPRGTHPRRSAGPALESASDATPP